MLGGLLAAAIAVAWHLWRQVGEVAIGGWGLAALGLGIVLSLALGGVQIALMIISNRRGYDETHRQ